MSKQAIAAIVAVVVLGLVGVGIAVSAQDRTPAKQPNVMIILWDTVRADRLSMYGYQLDTTPRMKAWADESGVVFENGISPAMWTVPSHASMFTGVPPSTHGAGFDHRHLDDVNLTIAEHLNANGYDTYAFSANPNLSPSRVNLLQGVDHIHLSWGAKFRGKVAQLTRKKLLKRDASTEISPAFKGGKKGTGFFNAGPVTHEAFTGWLDKRTEPDKPFYAYLSYMEAHKPRVPAKASRLAVADKNTVKVGLNTDLSFKSQLFYSYGKKAYTEEELTAVSRVYDATLRDLDEATADLLDDLEARGILDDTIVIFTADHGEMLGEHQTFGHRNGVYSPLVHVPLIISYPRKYKPSRVATPVSNMHIYDTILALTGVPKPEGAQGYVQGDLMSVAKQGPRAVFAESISIDRLGFGKVKKAFPKLTRDVWANKYRTVIEGDYKLIQTVDFDSDAITDHELYHLVEDPLEIKDIADANPDKAKELTAKMAAWRAEVVKWNPEGADDVNATESDGMAAMLNLLGYTEGESIVAGTAALDPTVPADVAATAVVYVEITHPAKPDVVIAGSQYDASSFPVAFDVTTTELADGVGPEAIPDVVHLTVRVDTDGDVQTVEPGVPTFSGQVEGKSTDLAITLH